MGKKVADYREDFYTFTGKASEVNRQLALAGVAVIWIFKNPEASKTLLPDGLLWPLALLIISLGLDLLQYFLGSVIWGIFFEVKEYQVNRQVIQDDNIMAPSYFSYTITFFFFLKIIAMVAAYVLLLYFFKHKL